MMHQSNSNEINDTNGFNGTSVLGAPVGSDKFIANWLDGRMIKFVDEAS